MTRGGFQHVPFPVPAGMPAPGRPDLENARPPRNPHRFETDSGMPRSYPRSLLRMRKLLLPALLLFSLSAAAETAQSIAVLVQPLGDSDDGVVARVTFRFVRPIAAEAGAPLTLQGSFLHDGKVIRNFRYAIPEERPETISTVQTFPVGNLDVNVRVIDAGADGEPAKQLLVANSPTFPIARMN